MQVVTACERDKRYQRWGNQTDLPAGRTEQHLELGDNHTVGAVHKPAGDIVAVAACGNHHFANAGELDDYWSTLGVVVDQTHVVV